MVFVGIVISQAQSDPASWIELLLGPAGLAVFLLITVWAFSTRRVISRGTYEELRSNYEAMTADRDRWQAMAIGLLGPVEEGTKVLREKL